MGAEFAFGIVGMMLIGWLIDKWLDSSPVGVLIGAGLGILGGGYNFIRQAVKMNQQASAKFRRDYPAGVTESKPDSDDRTEH